MKIFLITLTVIIFIFLIFLSIIEARKFDKKLKIMFDNLDNKYKDDYDYDSWEH